MCARFHLNRSGIALRSRSGGAAGASAGVNVSIVADNYIEDRDSHTFVASLRMRCLRLALLLTGAVMCGACFQFSTVLNLKADGSGTIEQRLLFTQAAVAQLRQFAALGG